MCAHSTWSVDRAHYSTGLSHSISLRVFFPAEKGTTVLKHYCDFTHMYSHVDSRFKHVKQEEQGDHFGEGQQER